MMNDNKNRSFDRVVNRISSLSNLQHSIFHYLTVTAMHIFWRVLIRTGCICMTGIMLVIPE